MAWGYLKPVVKNARYKVFLTDDRYFMIDISSSIWWILFPFLSWFYPIKAYEISEERAIEITYIEQKPLSVFNWIILFIVIVIFSILKKFSAWLDLFSFPTEKTTNIIIVGICLVILLTIRIVRSKKCKVRMNEIILGESSFKLYPKSVWTGIKITFSLLAIVCISLLMLLAFIEFPNIIFLFPGLMFTYALTLSNVMILGRGEIKIKECR